MAGPAVAAGAQAAGSVAGSLFGSQSAKKAAHQQRAQGALGIHELWGSQADQEARITEGRKQSEETLRGGYTSARETLGRIPERVTPIYERGYQQMSDLLAEGAGGAKDIYGRGFDRARGDIDAGYDAARQGTREAQQFYDPYASGGTGAISRMEDIATTGFEDSDILDRRMDRAAMRARERLGALGMSGSGEDVLAETGMADDIYTQEMVRHQNRQDMMNQMLYGGGVTAAGGQAGLGAQEAGYSAQEAQMLRDLSTTQAGVEAGVEQDLYGRLATLRGGQVQAEADLMRQTDASMADLYGTEAVNLANLSSEEARNLQAIEASTSAGAANLFAGAGDATAAATMAGGAAWMKGAEGLSRVAGDYFGSGGKMPWQRTQAPPVQNQGQGPVRLPKDPNLEMQNRAYNPYGVSSNFYR